MKMSKIGATRCHILKLKCTKFDFCWGSPQEPTAGAYSAPSDCVIVYKGPTSKGKGDRRERGREGRKGRRGVEKGVCCSE